MKNKCQKIKEIEKNASFVCSLCMCLLSVLPLVTEHILCGCLFWWISCLANLSIRIHFQTSERVLPHTVTQRQIKNLTRRHVPSEVSLRRPQPTTLLSPHLIPELKQMDKEVGPRGMDLLECSNRCQHWEKGRVGHYSHVDDEETGLGEAKQPPKVTQ